MTNQANTIIDGLILVKGRLTEMAELMDQIVAGVNEDRSGIQTRRSVALGITQGLRWPPTLPAAGVCAVGWADLGEQVTAPSAMTRLEESLRNCADVVAAMHSYAAEAEA